MSLCMSGDYVIILVHHKDILINVYNDNYVVLCIGCITCIYVTFSDQLLYFCVQTHLCKSCKNFFARYVAQGRREHASEQASM